MTNFIKKIQNIIKTWIALFLIKKILVPISLVIIYFFILGPTSIVVRIFFRKYIVKSNLSDSMWTEAENFKETLDSAVSQS